jgi:hypothetical protein
VLHSGERECRAPTPFLSVCTYDPPQIKRALSVLAAPAVLDKLKQTRGIGLFQRLAGCVFSLDQMNAFHAFLLMTGDFRG